MKTKHQTDDDAGEIATEAYIYGYPMVLMDVTRQVMTNAEAADPARARAPVNQFCHVPAFPDASFSDVVRPNADTLYSTMWFDVSREPLLIDVPDSDGRYYLLPMLDLWTDVFASPGSRATGTAAQTYALTGHSWIGPLPKGVSEIKAPTAAGWIIGRTQTDGRADYDAVRRFQAGLRATPLSAWKKTEVTPARATTNPAQDERAPAAQVQEMPGAAFFARLAELAGPNPPHAPDYPILHRMARIGLVPGRPFDAASVSPIARAAIEAAPRTAMEK